MKRISHLIAVMATALCGLGAQAQTPVDTVEHEVLLETTKGNIRVKLFNDTPRHRDHFMNWCARATTMVCSFTASFPTL